MATGTDPLRRQEVIVQARDTGARYEAPRSNAALQLASALADISPEVDKTLAGIAERGQASAAAKAKRDAITTSGARMADAVRMGTIEATQNPWYMQAYNRESAATRAQSAFAKLQTDSASWAEQNDPAAFEQKWREEAGLLARQFEGEDAIRGFAPVEAQFTQQALQSNTAANVARIKAERTQNLSALSAESLANVARQNGGVVTPNQAWAALAPAREQWFATGGSVDDWNRIMIGAITTASYSTSNPDLIDLMKAPELITGESEFGNTPLGAGVNPASPEGVGAVETGGAQAGPANPLPSPIAPPQPVSWPVTGRITSAFGAPRPGGAHSGLDIAVPVGTPVMSPGQGTVIAAGRDARSGNYVKVDYGNGVVMSYAHLSSVGVSKGDTISAGQRLGLSGDTGRGSGPHLHWRAIVNGRNVDPRTVQLAGAGSAQAPQDESIPAGSIEPIATVEAPQPQEIARGPSLYDIAGVADAAETDRYRISSNQVDGQINRLRLIRAQREAKGLELSDRLWAAHGNGFLTGNYDVRAIISQASGWGYSPQVIGEALGMIRGQVQDSAGLMQTRLAINGADPTSAKRIMDLRTEGIQNGYSADYERRVGQSVLRGEISGDDGSQMVAGSIARSRQDRAEARAEAREDRQANTATAINNYSKLRNHAQSLAGLTFQRMRLMGVPTLDSKAQGVITGQIADEMDAWLETHQGDFEGAYQAGRNYVARILAAQQRRAGQARPAGAQTQQNPNGNPRR